MNRHVVRFTREGRTARCTCRWGSDGIREHVIDAATEHAHANAGQLELAGAA
jgi:hypothetical protein